MLQSEDGIDGCNKREANTVSKQTFAPADFSADEVPSVFVHTRLLLGCANLQELDVHWMPLMQATAIEPAICDVLAGLACAYIQSLRVHFDPNLQSVLGAFVLYVQAEQTPHGFGTRLGPSSDILAWDHSVTLSQCDRFLCL